MKKTKMVITEARIRALNPCNDRFNNYLKHYVGKEFRLGQFMGLKNITQGDKLWVCFRLMPKENIHLAAADIAESVLHIFESKYPNDKRPRAAIEIARSGGKDAAYAAANAAAYAAYAAANAAYAAANAANAANAAKNKSTQEKLIRKIVMRHMK